MGKLGTDRRDLPRREPVPGGLRGRVVGVAFPAEVRGTLREVLTLTFVEVASAESATANHYVLPVRRGGRDVYGSADSSSNCRSRMIRVKAMRAFLAIATAG